MPGYVCEKTKAMPTIDLCDASQTSREAGKYRALSETYLASDASPWAYSSANLNSSFLSFFFNEKRLKSEYFRFSLKQSYQAN